MEKIADYINGNARVQLFEDGTRIVETDDDDFKFDFPLNIDVTITKKCENGCPYCYLGCNKDGKDADLMNVKFFDSLRPGTEMAINLNDLNHPQLAMFLAKMKKRGVIVNGTVNQKQFMNNLGVLKALCRKQYLHGIGISLTDPTPEFLEAKSQFLGSIVHVINGIVSKDDLEKLKDKNVKLLILGYKALREGANFKKSNEITISSKQQYLRDNLPSLLNHFEVVSFDNLAIEQLGVKNLISPETWEEFYQGDEGSATFAVDLVDGTFARNSMVTDPNKIYPIMDTVDEMFAKIQEEIRNETNG